MSDTVQGCIEIGVVHTTHLFIKSMLILVFHSAILRSFSPKAL